MSAAPLPQGPPRAEAAAAAEGSRDDVRRIPELDGLRGLAILSVLFWHYGALSIDPASGPVAWMARRALWLSWSGVDLFFVLSGFLIGGLLLENRDSPRYYGTFYVRRACRILPAYALVFAAALAASPYRSFGPLLPVWSYATFTQNLVMAWQGAFGSHWLAVTWSLAVEEQFYLVLPLLLRAIPVARIPAVVSALALAAPAARTALVAARPDADMARYVLMPARADALLLGVLAAWMWGRSDVRAAIIGRLRLLYVAAAVLATGAALLAASGERVLSRIMQTGGYSWLALLYTAVLLLVLAAPRSPLAAIARWRGLAALGTISYAVYLTHDPVMRLVLDFSGRDIALGSGGGADLIALALALTLGISALSWRLVEAPILRWGRSFRY